MGTAYDSGLDATGSSSSGSSGGADSGSGSTGSDGGTDAGIGDGATDGDAEGGLTCEPPDGGAPCDPGRVACGGHACSTNTQYCCVNGDAGTCLALGAPCGSNVAVSCNEAADCVNGVCCQVLALGPHSATCFASCPVGDYQACRSDSECGNPDAGTTSMRCIVQTCPLSANPDAGTTTIEACAYFIPAGLGGGTWGPLPACTAR